MYVIMNFKNILLLKGDGIYTYALEFTQVIKQSHNSQLTSQYTKPESKSDTSSSNKVYVFTKSSHECRRLAERVVCVLKKNNSLVNVLLSDWCSVPYHCLKFSTRRQCLQTQVGETRFGSHISAYFSVCEFNSWGVLYSFCVFQLRVRPVGDAVPDNGSLRKSALSESPLCCLAWLSTPR